MQNSTSLISAHETNEDLLHTHPLNIILHSDDARRPVQARLLARFQQPPIRPIHILLFSSSMPRPLPSRLHPRNLILRQPSPHHPAIHRQPAIPRRPMPTLIHLLVRAEQRLPLGAALRLVRLDPRLLAPGRDEARARPPGALLDVADPGDEPLALRVLAVLHAREEERHRALGEGGAQAGVQARRDRVGHDAGGDAADGDGVRGRLRRGDALGEHRGGWHGRVAAQVDDVRHVVDGPHAGDVEGAVEEGRAEGGLLGELLLFGERLEEVAEVVGEGGQGGLDAAPLCEGGGGGRVEVVDGGTGGLRRRLWAVG